MDLEHSAYRLNRNFRAVLALTLCFVIKPALTQANPGTSFATFADYRDTILKHISGAKKRILLYSDYVTDGEVVGTLHVAQYRNIAVNVVLNRNKANAYMSRYSYLQKNNIQVALRPASETYTDRTMLLVDETLYLGNQSLDFLSNERNFRLVVANNTQAEAFAASFSASAEVSNSSPPPVPMQGDVRHNKTSDIDKKNGGVDQESGPPAAAAETYFYNKKTAGHASDAARELPKQPLYLKNQRQAIEYMPGTSTTSLQGLESVLNPVTAREPIRWSPKSPESY